MRNLKRALSLALASVMLLGMMVVGTSAASYPDVDENDNVEAIEVLNAVNVMIGRQGNFEPDELVNRHEMAVIMAKLVLGVDTADNYVGTHPFTDVVPWADKYVAACYENDLISGTSATTYSGSQPLTAVQAALMMLRALGYKDLNKGATDWRAPITAMANQIRLFNGVASNPNDKLNRNQVAQLALNTLKSPMVNLVDNTITWNSNEGQVIMASGGRQYIALSSREAYARAINRVESAGTSASQIGGWTVELGEHLYNGDLKLNDVTDPFQRPARQWEYDGKEIGTYIKEELLDFEKVGEVTGKDLYDVLGKTAIDEYEMIVALDGVTDPDIVYQVNGYDGNKESLGAKHNQHYVFDAADLNRSNKGSVGATGTGVLTQVFVDPNYDNGGSAKDGRIWIAVINTYLARATQDYDSRREELTLNAYSVQEKKDEYVALSKKGTYETVRLGVEEYPVVKDADKDDAFLVTFAEGEVQTIVPAEVMEAVTVSSFKKNSNVVVDGTKYDFTTTAGFDAKTLDAYTGGSVVNLKDTTYNVFLDAYGNAIGVQEVDAKKNYVFIAAIDINNSNLVNGTADAKAVFLDGTVDTIRVNLDKSDLDWYTDIIEADDEVQNKGGYNRNSILNTWCTYTVNNSNVYTVKQVVDVLAGGDVPSVSGAVTTNDTGLAQYHESGFTSANEKIDKKHITLKGKTGTTGDFARVYGNEKTVYLTAELTNLSNQGGIWGVIKDVDTVTTGAENVNLTVWTDKEAVEEAETTSVKLTGPSDPSYATKGVYTLYDDDGIVIAAVVAGEDEGSAKNLVYVHSSSIESESYNGESASRAAGDGMWTWTRKVIRDGEEVTLTEVSDGNSELDLMKQYHWYQIKTNADGEVTGVLELPDDDLTKLKEANLDRYKDYALTYKPYTDSKGVTLGEIAYTVQNGSSTVLYWNQDLINSKISMNGRTLYVATDDQTGFIVSSNVKWVVQQWDNNKEQTYIDDGTTASGLKSMVDEINRRYSEEGKKTNYTYQVSAVIESGVASSVVIRLNENDYNRPDRPVTGDTTMDFDRDTGVWTLKVPTTQAEADALTITEIRNYLLGAKCTDIVNNGKVWSFVWEDIAAEKVELKIVGTKTEATKYAITKGTITGSGDIEFNVTSAAEGTTVTVTAKPADGYKTSSIEMNGTALTVTNDKATFKMPDKAVSVTATFVEDGNEVDITPILGDSAKGNAAAEAVTAKATDSKITVTGLDKGTNLLAVIVKDGKHLGETKVDGTLDWTEGAKLYILKGKVSYEPDMESGLLLPTGIKFDYSEAGTTAPTARMKMARAGEEKVRYTFTDRYLGYMTIKIGGTVYTLEIVSVKSSEGKEYPSALKFLKRDLPALAKALETEDLDKAVETIDEYAGANILVELPGSTDVVEIPVGTDGEPVLDIEYKADEASTSEDKAVLTIKAKPGDDNKYKINGQIVDEKGMTPTESDTAKPVESNDPLLTGLPFTLDVSKSTYITGNAGAKVADIQKNVKVEFDPTAGENGTFKVTGSVNYQDDMDAWETNAKGYFVAFDLDWTKLKEQVAADAKISLTYWDGETLTLKDITSTEGSKDILLSKVADANGTRLKTRGIQIQSTIRGLTKYYEIDLSKLELVAPELLTFTKVEKEDASTTLGDKKISDIQTGVEVSADYGTKTIKLTGTLHPVVTAWTDWSGTAPNTGYFVAIQVNSSAKNGTSVKSYNPNVPIDKTFEAGTFNGTNSKGETLILRVADLAATTDNTAQAATKGVVEMTAENGTERVRYTVDLSDLTLEKQGTGDVKVSAMTGTMTDAFGSMPAANFQKDLQVELRGTTVYVSGELSPVTFSKGWGNTMKEGYYTWFKIDASGIAGAQGWAVRGNAGGNCTTTSDDFIFFLGDKDLKKEDIEQHKIYVVNATNSMNSGATAPASTTVIKEYTLDFSGVTLTKAEPFTVETVATKTSLGNVIQSLVCDMDNYSVTVDHENKKIIVEGDLYVIDQANTPRAYSQIETVMGDESLSQGWFVTFYLKKGALNNTNFGFKTEGVKQINNGAWTSTDDGVIVRVAELNKSAEAAGRLLLKTTSDGSKYETYEFDLTGVNFLTKADRPNGEPAATPGT